MATRPVAIIMGSQSDWATMKHAADTLAALKIPYEAQASSPPTARPSGSTISPAMRARTASR